MKRIKTIETRDLKKSVKTGGCGECHVIVHGICLPEAAIAFATAFDSPPQHGTIMRTR